MRTSAWATLALEPRQEYIQDMENFLNEFPARRASYAHAIVSVLAIFAGTASGSFVIGLIVAVAAALADLGLGKLVHDRVSPAYSDGHPIVNMPPEDVA